MKDSPAVSILVPVYKVEKYLSRCIESVLAQDFTDWELILVDDGSPDRCPEICDDYARKDERIWVVHKENGGLVSARLAGFRESRGEYLIFLDSDDYLLSDALALSYKEITNGNFDIVRFRTMRKDSKGKQWLEKYEFIEGEITDNEAYMIYMLHNKIAPYLHSAIYKKNLFKTEVFRKIIKENISVGEDWVTNMLISPKVRKVKIINIPIYIYYWNTSSMMATSIISPLLNERIGHVLSDFLVHSSKQVQHEYEIKKIVGQIRAIFFYEIPFNETWYNNIHTFINNPNNRKEVMSLVETRFLIFIGYKYLYKVYSNIYSLFAFIVKLRCKKRNVIV